MATNGEPRLFTKTTHNNYVTFYFIWPASAEPTSNTDWIQKFLMTNSWLHPSDYHLSSAMEKYIAFNNRAGLKKYRTKPRNTRNRLAYENIPGMSNNNSSAAARSIMFTSFKFRSKWTIHATTDHQRLLHSTTSTNTTLDRPTRIRWSSTIEPRLPNNFCFIHLRVMMIWLHWWIHDVTQRSYWADSTLDRTMRIYGQRMRKAVDDAFLYSL